jgi:hypothetical protein
MGFSRLLNRRRLTFGQARQRVRNGAPFERVQYGAQDLATI